MQFRLSCETSSGHNIFCYILREFGSESLYHLKVSNICLIHLSNRGGFSLTASDCVFVIVTASIEFMFLTGTMYVFLSDIL